MLTGGNAYHPFHTHVSHARAQPLGLGWMPKSVLQAGFLETGSWCLDRLWEEGTVFWPTVAWQVVLCMLEKHSLHMVYREKDQEVLN